MAKRYFEFSEGTSNKFWEIWREGVSVFTRFGKIGAAGQVTVKKLGSDADAKTTHDKLVGEKTKKGYVEGGGQAKKKAAKPNGKANGKAVAAPASDAPEVIVIPDAGYRLEVVEGTSAKFWQIARADKTVTVTFGKIGTEGTTQKKKHKDEWEARSDLRKQLDDKKKKGYQYVLAGPRVAPKAAAIDPRLEAAVLKDPSDDAYMVYADWLMEQNDPRGELASLQARLAKSPKDKKLKNAEAKLRWDQRGYFYGPLAVYLTKKSDGDQAVAATWRQGWMDSLRLSAINEGWRDDAEQVPPVKNCEELVWLLPKVTSARLLRELVIGCPMVEDEFSFHATIKELVKVLPQLPALRRITLGDFTYEDSELSWSHLGSLKDFWKVAGNLEYLKIHAGSMDLGKIDAPELRELRIETGGFDKKALASIVAADLPKLETLNLWFGQDNYGCDVEPKHIKPLLDKKLPKLQHLGIANTTFGDDLAELVVHSKLIKQLQTLDLSMSHLTAAGIATYAAHKDALKHLASLDLSRCLIDKPGQKIAKTLAKTVKLDDQVDPSEHQPEEGEEDETWWRYSAVGE
jgi:uncharacterized protein (TIGR02996 family)